MPYRALFGRVVDRLEEKAGDYSYIKSRRAEEKSLKRAEKAVGLKLPTEFREFYATFSDGFLLNWSAEGELGGLEVPTLRELTGSCKDFHNLASTFENRSFAPGMGDERVLAIARQMKSWLPFQTDGEGNSLCVDCATEGSPVLYFQHDWFDGEGRDHGHVMAPNFAEFVIRWSRVCFLEPDWWPDAFVGRNEGWNEDWFPAGFRPRGD